MDYLTRLEQGRATSPSAQVVEEHREQAAHVVADLRLTAARYPHDARLRRLLSELRTASPGFVELRDCVVDHASSEQSRRKIIDHPAVGLISLDCDVLVVAGDDLRVMVYTAQPDTPDAQRLDLVTVLGTQTLVDEDVPLDPPTSRA